MKDIFIGFSEDPYPSSGWFAYPHELVPYWPMLKHRELLVLNYILRRTIGFQKSSDSISYSQFLHGVGNIDNGCGIKSSSTLNLALDGLVDQGFITREGGAETGRTNHYSLVYRNQGDLRNPNTSSSDSKEITSSDNEDTINSNSINIPQYITNNISEKYSLLEDINNEDLAEIASLYQVPLSFVSFQLEKLRNYCGSTGKTYKNYKKALSNFVLNAIQKSLEDEKRNNRYRGVDASHIH